MQVNLYITLVVQHTQLVRNNLQNWHIIIEFYVEVSVLSINFYLNSIFLTVCSLLKIGRIIF